MAKEAQPDAIIRADHFQQETDRDSTPANNAGKVPANDDDGYTHGNHIGPSSGDVDCAAVVSASGNPKALARIGTYFVLARGEGGALAGSPTSFAGFTKDANASADTPTKLNDADFTDAAVDGFTANAGDDRLLVVVIQSLDGSDTGSNVSGVTADGQAMIAAGTSTGSVIGGWDSGHYGVWYLPIGTNASSDDWTIDIAWSGTPEAGTSKRAIVLENIDQDNPLIYGAGYNSGSGGTMGGEFATDGAYFIGIGQDGSFSPSDETVGPAQLYAMEPGIETVSQSPGSRRVGALGVFRMSSNAVTGSIELIRGPVITGFSGLTVGGLYTLSTTTEGEIELEGDGPTVGIAKSATELWMFDPPKLRASGRVSTGSDTTISCGFRPSRVRIHATFPSGGQHPNAISNGGWEAFTGNGCAYSGQNNSANGIAGTSSSAWYLIVGSSVDSAGIIDNVSVTGFRLNFTTGGTANIYWEAEE
ncbi:MAG: hypothetical protein Tp172MES00d2C118482111_11 [Prokaryotic dsDNA virus sp.]|nr:MAG: hypothetical protein Tp172MES00d2C118482111_11 [Prokaryotic dsDNA virus sp.]|tara:strand:- start:7005 stop:8429 length:1425 start_codon:yes stop_codon:yes gene_type:complete